eukprot:GHVN01013128.1.p1 GENE.GHVN01013128.1~~GHVN01013128.1.p1  ORF type:complete len:210 (+),score=12.23 GHVN01013128.1:370-999(+)
MLNDVHLLRHFASIATMAAVNISGILGYVDRNRSDDADIDRRYEEIRTVAQKMETQTAELKRRLFATGNEYVQMSGDGVSCLSDYNFCLEAINNFKRACNMPQTTESGARLQYNKRLNKLRKSLQDRLDERRKNLHSGSAEVQTFDDQELCKSALQLIRKLQYNPAVEELRESLRRRNFADRDETFIDKKLLFSRLWRSKVSWLRTVVG